MKYCCLKNCSSRGSEVKMHTLPKDDELRSLWLKAINREELFTKDRGNYSVCDKHFSEDQKFPTIKNRTNLKFGSVPNMFLPEPAEVCVDPLQPGPSLVDIAPQTDCRLCYRKPGSVSIDAEKDLCDKILDTLQINVNDTFRDCLPRKICEDCHEAISNFYDLKQHVLKTNISLKQSLNSHNSHNEEYKLQTLEDGNYICANCKLSSEEEGKTSKQHNKIVPNNIQLSKNDQIVLPLEESKGETNRKGNIANKFECKHILKSVLVYSGKNKRTKVQCEICNQVFCNVYSLYTHKRENHFKCSFDGCSAIFDTNKDLYAHSITHNENYHTLCAVCSNFLGKKNTNWMNK